MADKKHDKDARRLSNLDPSQLAQGTHASVRRVRPQRRPRVIGPTTGPGLGGSSTGSSGTGASTAPPGTGKPTRGTGTIVGHIRGGAPGTTNGGNGGPPNGGGGTGTPPITTVRLTRGEARPTVDQTLWTAIRFATEQISFKNYSDFVDSIMVGKASKGDFTGAIAEKKALQRGRSLPFPGVEPYRLLKIATEAFLMVQCGVAVDDTGVTTGEFPRLTAQQAAEESTRYRRIVGAGDILREWRAYRATVKSEAESDPDPSTDVTFPYLAVIREKLGGFPLRDRGNPGSPNWTEHCSAIVREKLTQPCLLELLFCYWHEEGGLVQTLNAIMQRFQNVRGGPGNPLAQLEIAPLRPINNLLWAMIQDEQHRLSLRRRAYEYDHQYGLSLQGKAVPELTPADSRSKFLEAFHNLLQLCSVFYKQEDDTTVVADGFPILNALKDVHLLLSEGAHNQYGDLPWTARMEMMMQQWILARPEFSQFLPTREMVAYPEPWMDRVDAMKKLQGWTDVSVLHFHNLAVFGERILLSIRFGNWNDTNANTAQAANWAGNFRDDIQGYTYAYRAVTGVDVTDTTDTMARLRYVMPSVHLRNRVAAQPRSLQAPRSSPVPAMAQRALAQPSGNGEW